MIILLTRTIITHILKDNIGPEVNIINALMLLNQQQVTLNIENNKAETGFSNYLEVELSNDSDSVKVGICSVSVARILRELIIFL